jgi:hypothetical protein
MIIIVLIILIVLYLKNINIKEKYIVLDEDKIYLIDNLKTIGLEMYIISDKFNSGEGYETSREYKNKIELIDSSFDKIKSRLSIIDNKDDEFMKRIIECYDFLKNNRDNLLDFKNKIDSQVDIPTIPSIEELSSINTLIDSLKNIKTKMYNQTTGNVSDTDEREIDDEIIELNKKLSNMSKSKKIDEIKKYLVFLINNRLDLVEFKNKIDSQKDIPPFPLKY